MEYHPDKPLVVQSDRTLFLEVQHRDFVEVRDKLHAFCELLKSPEYIHTYRMTPLSLWNAAASGLSADDILGVLKKYAKFPLAYDLEQSIIEDIAKYGRFFLTKSSDDTLWLASKSKPDLERLLSFSMIASYVIGELAEQTWSEETCWAVPIKASKRGDLKQQCLRLGFPIKDEAGYLEGEKLEINLQSELPSGEPFSLRDYQLEAVETFYEQGRNSGGHGVLVLPCGAGKTIIGIASIAKHQCETLILTSHTTSVNQWRREIIEKTDLTEEQVGEYTAQHKNICPITIATYQMLTYRGAKHAEFVHMDVFQQRKWGLIIYDEVHLLPAPIFRATASIQSTRRLGLTATLVREDGREEDVFSLIGPKRYDMPWKDLENQGHIARALCTEVRVPFDSFMKEQYYVTSERRRARIAQENPNKLAVIEKLLQKHEGDSILIIGQYVDQLEHIGACLNVPVITGKMKQHEREELYEQFRQGKCMILAVSKVANFALDLPDATVAIQVSGTYGSRQEEAQRLGRILRPKSGHNTAYFYHLVTEDSKDQEYAAKRQLFLIEQGYHYRVLPSSSPELLEA